MSVALRALIWWVLGSALTLAAGEAERVRRNGDPAPGLCLASSVLLQGTGCPGRARSLAGDLL